MTARSSQIGSRVDVSSTFSQGFEGYGYQRPLPIARSIA